MTRPLITTMMLARDRATLLEASARSVLDQTERDLELVILDDGSRDGTWQVAEALAAKDPRVVLLRNEESVGIPAARNQVLAAARGRYLAVCDSDDLNRPTRLERQRALLDADAGLVGVGTRFHTFTGDDIAAGSEPGWHYDLRAGRKPFLFGSGMYRVDALRAVGGFDERRALAEDLDLMYRLAARGGRFATVDEVLLDYRRHARSATNARGRKLALEWHNLRAQLRGLRLLRGRFNARGYAVLVQSALRVALAAVGLRR